VCTFIARASLDFTFGAIGGAKRAGYGEVARVESRDLSVLEGGNAPVVLLFTDKAEVPAIWASLALVFAGALRLATVRDTNSDVWALYGVRAAPTILAADPRTLAPAAAFDGKVGYLQLAQWLSAIAAEPSFRAAQPVPAAQPAVRAAGQPCDGPHAATPSSNGERAGLRRRPAPSAPGDGGHPGAARGTGGTQAASEHAREHDLLYKAGSLAGAGDKAGGQQAQASRRAGGRGCCCFLTPALLLGAARPPPLPPVLTGHVSSLLPY